MNIPDLLGNLRIEISLNAVLKIIALFKRWKSSRVMCFKKLFSKSQNIPMAPVNKRALLFVINDYPGDQNDLNGCENDQADLEKKLNKDFPGFEIRKYKNYEVTAAMFLSELDNAISLLRSGDFLLVQYSGHGTQIADRSGDEPDHYDEAIFCYDKPVMDDQIRLCLAKIPEGAMVVLLFDSCFSGTISRHASICYDRKVKFVPVQGQPLLKIANRKITEADKGFVVLSGCGENQTSSDAWINGRYNGAFTFYALQSLSPGITYREWIDSINKYLPGPSFEQRPELEGDKELFNKIVFTNN